MLLGTALKLLRDHPKTAINNQLFHGNIVIMDRKSILYSGGIGSFFIDGIDKEYANRYVDEVVWYTHQAVWYFHIR